MKTLYQIVLSAFMFALMNNTAIADENPIHVFQLKGLGTLMDSADNPAEAPEGALCYQMDLISPKNNKKIGFGNDCFTEIVGNDDGSIVLTNTTFFFTNAGTLISEGIASIVPIPRLVADGGTSVVDGGSPEMTHLTGTIPGGNSADSILGGTGRFSNASGTVRLSGAVNMANFPGEIMFNCLFIIERD